mgnify:CR=1 FL=1
MDAMGRPTEDDGGARSPRRVTQRPANHRSLSARARRTRADLIAAARVVFERDGYTDSRIVDITALADSSAGTFYTYFDDKEQILKEVLKEAQEEMLHTADFGLGQFDRGPVEALREGLRAYLTFYRDNARLMLLIEQVAGIDPEFRTSRREREIANHLRNAESIRRWKERDGEVDPKTMLLTVNALSAMTNKMAYNSFAVEGREDFDEVLETVLSLWVMAFGLGAEQLAADDRR